MGTCELEDSHGRPARQALAQLPMAHRGLCTANGLAEFPLGHPERQPKGSDWMLLFHEPTLHDDLCSCQDDEHDNRPCDMTNRYLHNSFVLPVEFMAMARHKRSRNPDTGKRIKAARRAKGMTQKHLGELCGWGDEAQSRVSHYERGTREVSIGDLRLMASHLDRPVSWFLEGEHFTKLDEVEIEALTLLREMSDRQRQAFVDCLKAMAADNKKP